MTEQKTTATKETVIVMSGSSAKSKVLVRHGS